MKVIRERSLLGISERIQLHRHEQNILLAALRLCDELGDDHDIAVAKSAAERLEALLVDRLEISFTEQHL